MKGQYFSFDAIIASVIFVLALVALLSYWHSVMSFLEFQNDALSKDAVKISNNLFMPSAPSSECNRIERLGFANSWNDKKLNESILTCAAGKNMEWLKNRTGASYDLSIKVENLADNSVRVIGGSPEDVQNAYEVAKLRRLATVQKANGETYLATVDISIYR
ncbi:hypothetical protein JXA56_02280 [Candidatus Micrarchaeota archaeon]|nr:hypothetical protein [Candidatus Micrarchaeota archaeon]